jgi:hypothetical protein
MDFDSGFLGKTVLAVSAAFPRFLTKHFFVHAFYFAYPALSENFICAFNHSTANHALCQKRGFPKNFSLSVQSWALYNDLTLGLPFSNLSSAFLQSDSA